MLINLHQVGEEQMRGFTLDARGVRLDTLYFHLRGVKRVFDFRTDIDGLA